MERALELLNHFKIRGVVCVNKYDLNTENSAKIVEFCSSHNLRVVGKIPFDPVVTNAMVARKPVVEYEPDSKVSEAIKEMWQQTLDCLGSDAAV
jgi:MinD superfamily P-loop ATPase